MPPFTSLTHSLFHDSGVYCCALHPTLDVLVTGGRDAAVRVWDVRTKAQVHCMTGNVPTLCVELHSLFCMVCM